MLIAAVATIALTGCDRLNHGILLPFPREEARLVVTCQGARKPAAISEAAAQAVAELDAAARRQLRPELDASADMMRYTEKER